MKDALCCFTAEVLNVRAAAFVAGMETPSLNQAFLLTKSGQIRTMWDLCFDSRGTQTE